MGRKTKTKHVRDPSDTDDSTIPEPTSDEIGLLIPILKRVIVTVYPPLDLPLEIAYLVYDHADEISVIIRCISNGDREGAIKLATQIVVDEAISTLLNFITDYLLESEIIEIAEQVSSNVDTDEQTIETVKKVVQGTLSGITESVNEKIAGEVVKEVFKNEKE